MPEGQRINSYPSGTTRWVLHLIRTLNTIILQNSGLDAFFFLRYIYILFTIFAALSVIVVSSLIPLNSLSSGNAVGENQALDRLSWANIGLNQTGFYWAHLVMALVVIVFVCHTIHVELVFYIHVRNSYLTSPEHCLSEAVNTILVTDILKKDLSILRDLYSIFPGRVRSVWINWDLSALSKKMQERRKLVTTLEVAETRLIRLAVASFCQGKSCGLAQPGNLNIKDEEPLWKHYLGEKDRDHMYISINGWTWMPAIPFMNKRVDTICHCLRELARLNKKIKADQRELMWLDGDQKKLTKLESDRRESSKYPQTKSAFIQFNTQSAAYMACQTLLSFSPVHLSARHINVPAHEVRWSSLSQQWWNQYIQDGLVWTAFASLLVTWVILIAFTGFLSQVTTLADSVPWLKWLDKTSVWLSGFIQGVLPPLTLTILTALLPQILHVVTRWQSPLTETAFELLLQKYYFIFLFVQNFLTVSLSSSITAIIQDLVHGLDSAPALLARNVSKASNYFISYLTLQGLSGSAGTLLQAGGLIQWLILAPLTDRTLRQKWERQTSLSEIRWGTFYPLYTNLACIDKSLTSFLMALLTIQA